jgi:phosphatidylserine/phosphatidylglycerophosphate/cardiolipin synthase-like enzyme
MPQILGTTATSLTALEEMLVTAQTEVLWALPDIVANSRLLSDKAKERGLATWGDLFTWLCHRGVAMRILVADHDPLLSPNAHRRAWLAASSLAQRAHGDCQILVAPSPQTVPALWRHRVTKQAKATFERLKSGDPGQLTPVQRKRTSPKSPHHYAQSRQSFAVVDRSQCFVTNAAVRKDANLIGVRTEDGDLSSALKGHFADCWQQAMAHGAALANRPRGLSTDTRGVSRPDLRLLRSLTRPQPGLLPQIVQSTLPDALTQAITAAQRYVYLESTALTLPKVVAALKAVPKLILVLPQTLETTVLDQEGKAILATQSQVVADLAQALGDRFAVLVTPHPTANLALIDDDTVILGSSAYSQKATGCDTEVSVLVKGQEAATLMDARGALWLGSDKDPRTPEHWPKLTPGAIPKLDWRDRLLPKTLL